MPESTHGISEDRLRSKVRRVIARIEPLDRNTMEAARQRHACLTKPAGSLGRLERLAIQVAGVTRNPRPHLANKVVVVMAADHGVAAEGVSAYPSEVTAQMVLNFARGGAAINVLARSAGARVAVVDVGVNADLPVNLAIHHHKVARGTRSFVEGPAMTRVECLQAMEVGLQVVQQEAITGMEIVCLGEMGIGNTTAASAIVAAITNLPVADVTGRGTGIDDARWRHKVRVVERGLRTNAPDARDALDVLTKVGGLEIAALVGVTLAAAARQIPVLLDGFIATAAALIAVELCPAVQPYLIASHRSVEVGHRAVLERLELEPLFALDMRLGEGSGAALALPVVEAALAVLTEMATFEEAAVSGPAPAARGTEVGNSAATR